jgi:peptidoglycan/LPS O-acetylase OafA/YrhL
VKHSKILDGVRGLAILLVLLFHYNYTLAVGWVGVQLFFVLSGFLITSILLKEKEYPLGHYLKRFYWRRSLRIFPLYYSYLILATLIFIVAHLPIEFPTYIPFLASYTFNFFPLFKLYSYKDYFFMHFWSLSVEEQFYLMWPMVVFFCGKNQLRFVLAFMILISPLARFALGELMKTGGYQEHYIGETVYRFTVSQWDAFAFGAIIPVFSLVKKESASVGKLLVITLAALLALGALNLLVLWKDGQSISLSSLGYPIGELSNLQHVWSYSLIDSFFALLIIFSMAPPQSFKRAVDFIFGNSVLVYFGKISYGLYVYHWIIVMTFNKYFPISMLGLIAYMLTGVAVASISYFVFERPILSLKDRLFKTPNA